MASNNTGNAAFIATAHARTLAASIADLTSDDVQRRMMARIHLRRRSGCSITGCRCWHRFIGESGPFLCHTLADDE